MLRGLLPHLTAALLALHTVLGCCWHHAHACGQACDSVSHVESPHGDADHGANHCGTEDRGTCPSHGMHECLRGACVFLRLGENDFDRAVQFDLPFFRVETDVLPLCSAASLSPLFAADDLLPPLRLHLAHQVLLL
jgi:hypothetical protein